MIKRYNVSAFSTGVLLLLFLLGLSAAHAQQPPKSVTVGTNPAGTVFFALAGGLAKVISDTAPFQAVVQPYTGTSTFLPLLDNGELDLGVVNAVDMGLAYQGPARFKSGSTTGIVGDTCVQSYDIYLVGHKALSAQAVQATLKALWDNVDKLLPLHPQFKDWTRERAASADVTIPYHPTAIEFYKEKGAWSAKIDETQKKLLALNP